MNTNMIVNLLPKELQIIKSIFYDTHEFEFTDVVIHKESKTYGACTFILNGKKIEHRVAKITPTKTGQFVTIWKRNQQGITAPYTIDDDLDAIIITVKNNHNVGQFIFPKKVLVEKGIIAKKGNDGKRGIRVYPPWDVVTSKQATITQQWQLAYFIIIDGHNPTEASIVKRMLFECS
jgi:hypothetical protein